MALRRRTRNIEEAYDELLRRGEEHDRVTPSRDVTPDSLPWVHGGRYRHTAHALIAHLDNARRYWKALEDFSERIRRGERFTRHCDEFPMFKGGDRLDPLVPYLIEGCEGPCAGGSIPLARSLGSALWLTIGRSIAYAHSQNIWILPYGPMRESINRFTPELMRWLASPIQRGYVDSVQVRFPGAFLGGDVELVRTVSPEQGWLWRGSGLDVTRRGDGDRDLARNIRTLTDAEDLDGELHFPTRLARMTAAYSKTRSLAREWLAEARNFKRMDIPL